MAIIYSLGISAILSILWLGIALPILYRHYVKTGNWTEEQLGHIFSPTPDIFWICIQTCVIGLLSFGLSLLGFRNIVAFMIVVAILLFVLAFVWKAQSDRKKQILIDKLSH